MVNDDINIDGIIKVRRIPDWTPEEYAYWWLPEKSEDGRIIRPARMSQKEKDRFTEAEAKNLVTTNGKNEILKFMQSSASYGSGWGGILSIGTGVIASVATSDTTVTTDNFLRLGTPGTAITGNAQDLSFTMTGTNGNGTFTNLGLYGVGATTTYATGTLMSHALIAYVKITGTVVIDYTLTIT